MQNCWSIYTTIHQGSVCAPGTLQSPGTISLTHMHAFLEDCVIITHNKTLQPLYYWAMYTKKKVAFLSYSYAWIQINKCHCFIDLILNNKRSVWNWEYQLVQEIAAKECSFPPQSDQLKFTPCCGSWRLGLHGCFYAASARWLLVLLFMPWNISSAKTSSCPPLEGKP